MTIVLDASVAVEWFIEGKRAEEAKAVARRMLADTALVPQLWPLELSNVLSLAVRKGVISASERTAAFGVLRSMAVELDAQTSVHAWSRTVALSDGHRLTAYDACYLELAIRAQLPLATLDRALAEAARAEGVTVLP